MKNIKTYRKLLLLLMLPIIALIVKSCANPGPLTGGEKDIDPPVFLGSEPQNFSRNVKPKKVFMEFDEFLVLKELNQNMIVSPPLNEEPEVKLRGKKVLIKNHKDLVFDTNTTYTYFFGDAIRDLHEDNPISDFEFVFSTGDRLDSLSIRGTVLNSRYLIPEESIYVCLYKKYRNDTIPFDSLPYFVRPYYIARTNEEGEYVLNNLKYDDYLVFAVKDMNNNYFFDMPNEDVAFVDTLIFPEEIFDYIPDTIPIDTSDVLLMDSLWENHSLSLVKNPTHLFMYSEDDSVAKLITTEVLENKKIDFFFKFPVRDSLNIRLMNDSTGEPWYMEEYSTNKDTLSLWITRIPSDSLKLEIRIDTIQADTLNLRITPLVSDKKPKKKSRRRSKDDEEKKEKVVLKYQANIKTSLAYHKDIRINFETPLDYANFENVSFKEDSIYVKPNIKFTDSVKRNILVDYDWKQETKYELIFPQESLIDIFGLECDSIIFNFTTTSEDNYSNIILDLKFDSLQNFPVVISLVKGEGDKEVSYQKHRITSDTNLTLSHINEGEYLIKALEDSNDNGKWNTGSYGKRLSPEAVYYLQKYLTTKAGWDINETWSLSQEDRKRPIKPKKEKTEEENSGPSL